MEFILEEKRRPWSWYYENGEYICIDDAGTIRKRIFGELWPNPNKLTAIYREEYDKASLEVKPYLRTQADPVIYTIYNDYQKRKQA